MKKQIHLYIVTLVILLSHIGLPAVAQNDSLLMRSFDYIKQREAWHEGYNAAFLHRFAYGQVTHARIQGQYADGGLCDYYQSPKSLSLDAQVESFYRLSPRTVLYGLMEYTNRSDREIGGSAFIHPSTDASTETYGMTHSPFDIMEDSLSNTGRKHLDQYHLVGALSTNLYRGIALGAKFDFTSANYAKYKDLRHKNSLMDLTATVGVSVPVGSHLSVGANYLYRRSTESMRFSIYGTTDKVYKSLVEYAAFMGNVETFGGEGFTDKSHEMPLFNEVHGVGFQTDVRITEALSWYQEFTMAYRRGYYGKPSPYTVSHSQHNSHLYGYRTRLQYALPTVVHRIDVVLNTENLVNKANTYMDQTGDNTSSYYEYYEPVKMSNRVWFSGSAFYTADLGVRGEQAAWTLMTGAQWLHRKQTGYHYPYYRRQQLDNWLLSASLQHHLYWQENQLTARLGLLYQTGSGDPYEDGTFVEPSDKQSAPAEMTDYLMRNYEYLTKSQWGGSAMLRYSYAWHAVRMKPYVELRYQYQQTSSVEWLEASSRHQLTLSVGTTF